MKYVIALSLLVPALLSAMSAEQQMWQIVRKDDKNALAALLGNGKNPLASARDHSGRTLLHDCACNFKPALIPLLVAAGADINDCNNAGHTTPLIEAVNAKWWKPQPQEETVQVLLSFNPDPTIKDSQERTVLQVASLYGDDRDFVPTLKEYVNSYSAK